MRKVAYFNFISELTVNIVFLHFRDELHTSNFHNQVIQLGLVIWVPGQILLVLGARSVPLLLHCLQ